MRLRKPLIVIAAAASTALVLTTASPAFAADTEATFAINAGSITLAVAPTATLTAVATGSTAITGSLGAASVTDARGGEDVWSVSVVAEEFTNGSSLLVSTAVSYTAGEVTVTGPGTATVADGTATAVMTDADEVFAAADVSGNNTASWTPSIAVTMPAGALAGSYTSTVTTSLV
jgi:hypothetical protein